MTALDFQAEAVRQAGEVALMVYAAVNAESGAKGIEAAILMVLGDELREGGAKAGGEVIVKLALAHTLALVRLAELGRVPLTVAAADLVSISSKGAK